MKSFTWAGFPLKTGDRLIYTSFFENYFKNTNEKLIDTEKHFVTDYNPYVIRDTKEIPTEIFTLWGGYYKIGATQAETICNKFGLKCYLNHPRLYKYEQIKQSKLYSLYNSVVCHFRGESVGMVPIEIQNHIINKYKERGWWTIQVGNTLDYYCGADFDRRNNTFWETCKYVAEAQEAICVDSCVYHTAKAYDTRIKVILVNKTEQELLDFRPLMWDFGKNCGWIGINCEVYNCYPYDLGLTRSFLKI